MIYKFDRHELKFLLISSLTLGAVFVLGHYGAWAPAKSSFSKDDSPLQIAVLERQTTDIVRKRQARLAEEEERNRLLDPRLVARHTIADHVPAEGKFIGVDLVNMELMLYEDGSEIKKYAIIAKGRPGSFYETPSGSYEILLKLPNHFSTITSVWMPYSMQFYGNFFIHGWPYYADGRPVHSTYSGGCIRLSTSDAREVFSFARVGTGIFVYDHNKRQSAESLPQLKTRNIPKPKISARAFLLADVDRGEILIEHNAQNQRPIASITKLMTAVVANETISFDRAITVRPGENTSKINNGEPFVVGNLMYPLIMESDNAAANALASFFGKDRFVQLMNQKAKALGMINTYFEDPSGQSHANVSTAQDLLLFAQYIYDKKGFILNISKEKEKSAASANGRAYIFRSNNIFAHEQKEEFIGGKTGLNGEAKGTMLSLFSVPIDEDNRTIAVIVLGSDQREEDTRALLAWFKEAVAAK